MPKRFATSVRRWAALAVCVVLTVATVSTGRAAAEPRAPGLAPAGRSFVGQGADPASMPGSVRTGPTRPNTRLSISIVLQARNLADLQRRVSSGWTGPYLTVSQFAERYGQPTWVIDVIRLYLSWFGISTLAYPNNLVITAQGTVKEFARALQVHFSDFRVPAQRGASAQNVHAPVSTPSLPSQFAPVVLSVLGLNDYAPYVSDAAPALGHRTDSPAASIPPGELSPTDFVDHYDLAPLLAAGHQGQGQTVGIVTFASFDPSVPETFWSQYLHLPSGPNRISIVNVDGGSGPVGLANGSDETTLDIEQAGGVAPGATIAVYQAPNTDSGGVDAFFAAAALDVAGSVSSSWTQSEAFIGIGVLDGRTPSTYPAAEDEAFLELAAQGQSTFTAAGDQGAFGGSSPTDQGTTSPTVVNPGDSPYVTTVGGTTLPGTQVYGDFDSQGNLIGTESVTIPKELSWSSDYLWPLYRLFGEPSPAAMAVNGPLGSGGGYSLFESRPSYQQAISGIDDPAHRAYLTPTGFHVVDGIPLATTWTFDPAPPLGTSAQPSGRAVPDLAFDADPQTGYAVYDPELTPLFGSPVQQFGGTSFVAPQLAAADAVMQGAVGHRLGLWNPTIYAAASSPASPFHPIDDNSVFGSSYYSQTDRHGHVLPLSGSFSSTNLWFTGTPGTVYNPATGLGTADLAQLEAIFAGV
jgi:subtilase family serine protease